MERSDTLTLGILDHFRHFRHLCVRHFCLMKNIMTRPNEKGLTLVELLVALTIMGIIVVAAMPLLSSSLEANHQGTARSELYQEGLLAMERMTGGVRKTTIVTVPNGHSPTRDILVFSRLVNSDNDFYFGDPLFPRIDEDPNDYFSWSGYGVQGVDEDDDGSFDEGNFKDDDEDALVQEDPLDGLDNDGDGTIDEEVQADYNGDGETGILGIDDDADGSVDEGISTDDDEDGSSNEEDILFLVYTYDSSNKTLTEIHSDPFSGINDPAPKVVLSNHVTDFEVKYQSPSEIRIKLTLTGDDGEVVYFNEHVCPRNTLQKTGKRVR
jgi:prepilin-type N-terminal cleavage/methylation domain-containing protein